MKNSYIERIKKLSPEKILDLMIGLYHSGVNMGGNEASDLARDIEFEFKHVESNM